MKKNVYLIKLIFLVFVIVICNIYCNNTKRQEKQIFNYEYLKSISNEERKELIDTFSYEKQDNIVQHLNLLLIISNFNYNPIYTQNRYKEINKNIEQNINNNYCKQYPKIDKLEYNVNDSINQLYYKVNNNNFDKYNYNIKDILLKNLTLLIDNLFKEDLNSNLNNNYKTNNFFNENENYINCINSLINIICLSDFKDNDNTYEKKKPKTTIFISNNTCLSIYFYCNSKDKHDNKNTKLTRNLEAYNKEVLNLNNLCNSNTIKDYIFNDLKFIFKYIELSVETYNQSFNNNLTTIDRKEISIDFDFCLADHSYKSNNIINNNSYIDEEEVKNTSINFEKAKSNIINKTKNLIHIDLFNRNNYLDEHNLQIIQEFAYLMSVKTTEFKSKQIINYIIDFVLFANKLLLKEDKNLFFRIIKYCYYSMIKLYKSNINVESISIYQYMYLSILIQENYNMFYTNNLSNLNNIIKTKAKMLNFLSLEFIEELLENLNSNIFVIKEVFLKVNSSLSNSNHLNYCINKIINYNNIQSKQKENYNNNLNDIDNNNNSSIEEDNFENSIFDDLVESDISINSETFYYKLLDEFSKVDSYDIILYVDTISKQLDTNNKVNSNFMLVYQNIHQDLGSNKKIKALNNAIFVLEKTQFNKRYSIFIVYLKSIVNRLVSRNVILSLKNCNSKLSIIYSDVNSIESICDKSILKNDNLIDSNNSNNYDGKLINYIIDTLIKFKNKIEYNQFFISNLFKSIDQALIIYNNINNAVSKLDSLSQYNIKDVSYNSTNYKDSNNILIGEKTKTDYSYNILILKDVYNSILNTYKLSKEFNTDYSNNSFIINLISNDFILVVRSLSNLSHLLYQRYSNSIYNLITTNITSAISKIDNNIKEFKNKEMINKIYYSINQLYLNIKYSMLLLNKPKIDIVRYYRNDLIETILKSTYSKVKSFDKDIILNNINKTNNFLKQDTLQKEKTNNKRKVNKNFLKFDAKKSNSANLYRNEISNNIRNISTIELINNDKINRQNILSDMNKEIKGILSETESNNKNDNNNNNTIENKLNKENLTESKYTNTNISNTSNNDDNENYSNNSSFSKQLLNKKIFIVLYYFVCLILTLFYYFILIKFNFVLSKFLLKNTYKNTYPYNNKILVYIIMIFISFINIGICYYFKNEYILYIIVLILSIFATSNIAFSPYYSKAFIFIGIPILFLKSCLDILNNNYIYLPFVKKIIISFISYILGLFIAYILGTYELLCYK